MTLDEARDAFDANETTETARSYFFTALEYWKDEMLDDIAIEYVAYECGPFLVK